MKYYRVVVFLACCWLSAEAAAIFQFPETPTFNIYTPEMTGLGSAIVGQDEGIYVNLLTANAADLRYELLAATLAAYDVSQEVGQCAAAVQRSTAEKLQELTDQTKATIGSASDQMRKVLSHAKTPSEIATAFKSLMDEKVKSSGVFSSATVALGSLTTKAMVSIQECVKN